MHKCKECGSIYLHPEKLICEKCRLRRRKIPITKCLQCGVDIEPYNSKKYCAECGKSMRKHYELLGVCEEYIDMIPETRTSNAYLDKFKPWIQSGLPYEEWRQNIKPIR